jgi:hypothetical protein
VIRRLLDATGPAEARFFLFVGGFGLVLGVIYWFVSYELAGTVLLGGFGVGAGILGLRMRVERPAGRRGGRRDVEPEEGPGGGETPFRDDSGRLPEETLAPLALGLGIALALTAVVFGPWLLVAGIVPLAWGAWTWLAGAREELTATVADDASRLDGQHAAPVPAPQALARGDDRAGH